MATGKIQWAIQKLHKLDYWPALCLPGPMVNHFTNKDRLSRTLIKKIFLKKILVQVWIVQNRIIWGLLTGKLLIEGDQGLPMKYSTSLRLKRLQNCWSSNLKVINKHFYPKSFFIGLPMEKAVIERTKFDDLKGVGFRVFNSVAPYITETYSRQFCWSMNLNAKLTQYPFLLKIFISGWIIEFQWVSNWHTSLNFRHKILPFSAILQNKNNRHVLDPR